MSDTARLAVAVGIALVFLLLLSGFSGIGDGAEADDDAYTGCSLRFSLTGFAGFSGSVVAVAFCAPAVPVVVAFAAVALRVVLGAGGGAVPPRLRFIGAIFVGQGGRESCYMR